jgi:hypothetical protein
MRHGNFCDRLISRMTCGGKSKERRFPALLVEARKLLEEMK